MGTVADPDTTDARAFAAVRTICRRQAKGFYLSSVFLPRAKRDAAHAVYAFWQMIQDATQQARQENPAPPSPTTVAGTACCSGNSFEQRIELFRAMLDDIYAGRMELPLPDFRTEAQHALHAFAHVVHRYEIPQPYFLELLEGFRMDLTIPRYATWNALETYCHRTGGVAGQILSCVFGLQHSEAGQQAALMGNAMRFTAILRDVGQDRARGKIYLPLEDMVRFGYSERDLSRGIVNDQFRELMKFEIARARRMYRAAAGGFRWLADDGSRLTAATLAVSQSGVLSAIEADDYDVFGRRPALSTFRRLRRLPSAWTLARRDSDEAIPEVF